MISVNGISKHFGKTLAVDNLSFQVNQGEIFGIVGPDGAGKSTLLRMLAAILQPEAGTVTIKDTDIYKDPYHTKENLAYMPQRFGLYEDLSVEENIFFFGRLFGMTKAQVRQRVKRLYEFSRLEPFKKRLAGKLSGGMKQKLGLACSLIHGPELILLDEPTNGVDPVSRREFWKILYELLAEGVTIVVSTAYLDEAERCNRVALMYRGNFVTSGSPDEIKGRYGNNFVEILTDNPHESEHTLRQTEDFSGAILAGPYIHLFVDNIKKAEKDIRKLLKSKDIGVAEFRERRPTLEDCFVHIIAHGGKDEK